MIRGLSYNDLIKNIITFDTEALISIKIRAIRYNKVNDVLKESYFLLGRIKGSRYYILNSVDVLKVLRKYKVFELQIESIN